MVLHPEPTPSRPRLLNAPPTVLWLILLLLLCHAVRVALPSGLPDLIVEQYGLTPARFAAALNQFPSAGTLPALVIPFFSYMLIHADYTHVGVNCLWLLVFGPVVARTLKPLRFLLFFLTCGIAAALLHLLVYWGSPVAVIGASGAISGLMGAGIRLLFGHMHQRPDGLAPVFSRQVVTFSVVWTIVNIVSGVFRIGVTGELSLVAWIAHLGGYFTGLLTIGLFQSTSRTVLPAK